ncbi:cyclodeaminase [Halobacillus litoralis]|uniref:Cyclodeaminase n=1 Tax=Halobacillus litoralis TaxID=45668 RepID=A0A845F5S8_9BACI|nr:cyclodeaminase [Halobacillus litoralis]
MRLYERKDIEKVIRLDTELIDRIETAFTSLVEKETTMPPIMRVDVPDHNGEVDIKSAYIKGEDSFAVKLSSGFFNNPALGLPSANGLMILINSHTGEPLAVLADKGWLTDLRTAAAGAVAAKYGSRKDSRIAGILGTGAQARLQLQALMLVRPIEHVFVYGRSPEKTLQYKQEMEQKLGINLIVCDSVEQVVGKSDLVVTTTPSKEPLIYGDWIRPGLHITAMGSDAEQKRELDATVLERADVIVCDVKAQSARLGELRASPNQLDRAIELGEVTSGKQSFRQADEDITICDLTGTGVQDTAIARHVYHQLLVREGVTDERRKV